MVYLDQLLINFIIILIVTYFALMYLVFDFDNIYGKLWKERAERKKEIIAILRTIVNTPGKIWNHFRQSSEHTPVQNSFFSILKQKGKDGSISLVSLFYPIEDKLGWKSRLEWKLRDKGFNIIDNVVDNKIMEINPNGIEAKYLVTPKSKYRKNTLSVAKNGAVFTITRQKQSLDEEELYEPQYNLTGRLHISTSIEISYSDDTSTKIFPDSYEIWSDSELTRKLILTDRYDLRYINAVSSEFDITITNGRISEVVFENEILPLIQIYAKLAEIAHYANKFRIDREKALLDSIVERDEMTCVICFQPANANPVITLCCGAITHKEHLSNWLVRENTCPYCKSEKPKIRFIDEIKSMH